MKTIKGRGYDIVITGSMMDEEEAYDALTSVTLSGITAADRLMIQRTIDDFELLAEIVYNGKKVYGYEEIVSESEKTKRAGLYKGSKNFIEFLTRFADGKARDIVKAFDNDYYEALENLDFSRIPAGFCDMKRIAERLTA